MIDFLVLVWFVSNMVRFLNVDVLVLGLLVVSVVVKFVLMW